jgi:hypothetical protein
LSHRLFCHRIATFLNTATTNHGGSSMQHHTKLPQCNLAPTKLPTQQYLIITSPHSSRVFAREGEDVAVARVRISDCMQGIEPCECKGKGHRFQRVGLLGCFSLVKERKESKE